MDRLIASNSVPLAQADTAPPTGTPQYATDGNPATNVPATLWPAYAFNALQDEIYNVIVAAGLTPNRNTWNQLLAAIESLVSPGCYLGTQVMTTSGTYTPGTYMVNGVSVTAKMAIVEAQAAGAAGGGPGATGSGVVNVGTGGNAGTYAKFLIPRGSLVAMSVTVGAAGTGVSGANGNAGGNLVFGSLCTCPGGVAGQGGSTGGPTASPDVFPSNILTAAATITAPAIALANVPGQGPSAPAFIISTAAAVSSPGGNSPLGTGGGAQGDGVGGAGLGWGAGGGGGANSASQSAKAGGNGAQAGALVHEYA